MDSGIKQVPQVISHYLNLLLSLLLTHVQSGCVIVWPNTVEYMYYYNAVQHNMILHMVRQRLRQNMHQRLYSQKTPHISPSWVSYGVSFGRIWVEIDCIILALRCISDITTAEHKSDFGPIKDFPYLPLMGELWGVYCEYFGENWLRYNSIALYIYIYIYKWAGPSVMSAYLFFPMLFGCALLVSLMANFIEIQPKIHTIVFF